MNRRGRNERAEEINKISRISPYLSPMTESRGCIIKKDGLNEWIKKQDPSMCCLQ